jgi:RimJ/RimL family protein N-acetyltransferase
MMTDVPSMQRLVPRSGPDVRLTALQRDHIHTHFRWNNDPELNRLDSEVPFEKESFGAFKQRFERLCDHPTETHYAFEIHSILDNMLIGVAALYRVSPAHQHGCISLTIGDRAYWGRGYGRRAMNLLLSLCFADIGLHRVAAETFEFNDAWTRLVKGAGFSYEGTAADYLYRDGQFWDKEHYALLEDDYTPLEQMPVEPPKTMREEVAA